jgi:hypothetical protein
MDGNEKLSNNHWKIIGKSLENLWISGRHHKRKLGFAQ